MTDLIERLRENPNYRHWLIMAEAADEIERLQAWKDEHSRTEGGECPFCEIERLQKLYDVAVADRVRMHEEIERLQAVVDAHIKYGLFCNECIEAGRTECIGHVDGQDLRRGEMTDPIPTRDRIMALLSPPSQDVYLVVEDARWIKAEIERLQKRNALLEDVAVAADDVAQYCEIDAAGWMDSLIAALDKPREAGDE